MRQTVIDTSLFTTVAIPVTYSMFPITSKTRGNQAIRSLFSESSKNFSFPLFYYVAEDEYKGVVREEPITVVEQNGQVICQLCQRIADLFAQDVIIDSGDQSQVQYKDFKELDSLARAGCATCKIFRAEILYRHPARNAYEILMYDDQDVSIYRGTSQGAENDLVIRHPNRRSMSEFHDFDPEWPMGRPDMHPEKARIWGIDLSSSRRRYKKISTSSFTLTLTRPSLSEKSREKIINGIPTAENYDERRRAYSEDLESYIAHGDDEIAQQARIQNFELLPGW